MVSGQAQPAQRRCVPEWARWTPFLGFGGESNAFVIFGLLAVLSAL